jgi:3-phenylpropionate/trans-cinnamate dioxygenase ferredoxin reductase subunit
MSRDGTWSIGSSKNGSTAMTTHEVVIVGGSLAGISTAQALRRNGFDAPITVVGDELHPPYDRPPLSKQVLSANWTPAQVELVAPPALDALGTTLLTGRTAVGLDVERGVVQLHDGAELAYGDLVIATGLRARPLFAGPLPRGAHVLRSLDDATALRDGLRRGPGHIVIIGAGFIGLEVGATVHALGLCATLIEPASRPLARVLPAEIGRYFTQLHVRHGNEFRFSTGVDALVTTETNQVCGVTLEDASTIPADLVVIAIGAAPCTDWLAGSAIACQDGVLVDAHGSARPNVYAVGDVARWFAPGPGRSVRLEHRTHAIQQAAVVAHNLVAGPDAQRDYDPFPYVWSDQFGSRLQIYGWPGPADEVHVLYDRHDSYLATTSVAGRLRSVVGVNAAADMRRLLAPVREMAPLAAAD